MRSSRASGGSRRLIHLALALIAGIAVVLSLAYVWLRRHDPGVLLKDWYCFYSAGAAFLEEGASAAYVNQCIKGQFWLYPPYFLYPYALGNLLAPLQFYALVVAEVLAATAIGLYLLGKALPRDEDFATVPLAVVSSAPFIATLVMGQHSALLLLGIAAGLWALTAGRPAVAGIAFGMLGIKPNWAIVFVVWLLFTRRWKTLGAMSAVGALMILSTLPMGLEVWVDYFLAVPESIGLLLNTDGGFFYPPQKLITFEAFSRSTIGVMSPVAGKSLWVLLEVLAIVACLVVWRRSDDVRDQLAVAVLAAIALNVYVEFYDALVLAVPAAIWWTGTERYAATVWKLLAWLIGSLWLGFWLWSLWERGPGFPSLAGAFLAVWIASEAYRALTTCANAAEIDSTQASPPPAAG